MTDPAARAVSALGFVVLLGVAWLFSSDRRGIAPRPIVGGIGLQFALALALLHQGNGSLTAILLRRRCDAAAALPRRRPPPTTN